MKVNRKYVKQIGQILAFFLGFWVLSMWYFSPALDDQMLQQGDMQQVRMMTQNAHDIKEQTGSFPNWSDRLFSGMPSNLITGVEQGSLLLKWKPLTLFQLVEHPFDFLFISMISMFLLLYVLRVSPYMGAAAAIGYAFMTFTMSSFEAGHITKVLAMSLLPGVIAGLMLLNQKKWLQGGVALGLFFGMLINYFHYQIAYYAGIIMLVYAVVELWATRESKDWKSFGLKIGVMSLASLLAVLTSVGKIYDTMQYSKATMRGGSEVTSEMPSKGQSQVGADGLDIDYAFSWSYGLSETFTLFVPRFKGGSSNELVPDTNPFGVERLPTYFGEMQFTSGPVYMGAILIFLFVLSVVFSFKIKQWKTDDDDHHLYRRIVSFGLVTVVVSILLSWGKYFFLNEYLFEYLPYYNKFRTPMMALSIAQAIIPFIAIYGLYKILSFSYKPEQLKSMFKTTWMTAAVLLGITMIIAYGQGLDGPSDAQYTKSGNAQVIPVFKELRSDLLWGDIWRSAIFLVFAVGLVWAGINKKLKAMQIGLILTAVVAIDLIGISSRYLTDEQWVDKEEETEIQPSILDQQIMEVNKDNSRVFDLRYSPFNDNHSAPFHRNVGGYHPAKLSRYQDIISYGITKSGQQLSSDVIMNNQVLDMLNCRYVLTKDPKTGKEDAMLRSTALGQAWFVDSVETASDAKSALNLLSNRDLSKSAIIEEKFENKPSKLSYVMDSSSTRMIRVRRYTSDSIYYEAVVSDKSLAVFSEVHYNEQNGAWKVYIDNKPATPLQVNYILRGVEIPEGKHNILWVYEPADRGTMIALETASSAILILALFGVIALPAFRKEEDE